VINYDENVKAIFINIFGGITRCDEVARGIIQAMGRVELRAPLIVRLDGTNATEGRKIIEENASDRLIMKPNMLVAAQTAVEIAKGN
nr:succinate--CoA ligase subunit beta [Anaerolineae bacterium]